MDENPGRWFERRNDFVAKERSASEVTSSESHPDLYVRCPKCDEMLYSDALRENLQVCSSCKHHFILGAIARINSLADKGSIEPHDMDLISVDTLSFVDSKSYTKRLELAKKKSQRNDAFVAASCEISGVPVEIGAFEFSFMGGSMGSVVGEGITRCLERALERKVPAILVSSSGGARMQEGVLSLMQMAKSCAALSRLSEAGIPYISILTHPTTGGVAASFAMLGDVILAEPKALIGFAGPRVIQQTIGEELPAGFQRSEYLIEHGMIDQIVERADMKNRLTFFLKAFLGLPAEKA
jgi:acetyl-CoA carboxylase carboxyl transferase subunit beta